MQRIEYKDDRNRWMVSVATPDEVGRVHRMTWCDGEVQILPLETGDTRQAG